MMRIYIEKLSKETIQTIENRAYSREELEKICTIVKKKDRDKRKGFRRACLITAIVWAVIILLSLPAATTVLYYSLAAIACFSIILLLGIKYIAADKMKRQYLKALHKGYPDWENQLGASFFSNSSETDLPLSSGYDIGVPFVQIQQTELPAANERFRFVIEDMFVLNNRIGLVGVGFVKGTVKKGAKAYVIFPEYHTVRETNIIDMEIPLEGKGFQKVNSASDCHVSLLVSGFAQKSEQLKNAVITNVLSS